MDNRPSQGGEVDTTTGRWLDLGCLVAVWLVAFFWVWWTTGGGASLPYDAFRDLAWAENMVEGQVWSDPSTKGATWWYAPLGPAWIAALSRVFDASPAVICARSALVLNPMLPVLLFLVVRRSADRWVALLATPFLVFGSMWWMTHLGATMPSIQAATGSLLVVLLWTRCVDVQVNERPEVGATLWRGAAAGAVLAVVAWWHPVCAVVAAGAAALHGFGLGVSKRVGWKTVAVGLGSVAGVSALLSALAIWHILGLPRLNATPMRYVAPEMFNPDFAAAAYAPGVLLLALIGLVLVLKVRSDLGWVVGWLVVGVLGQIPAYVSFWETAGLPMLVPHEFQWHGQLAIAVLASVGLVEAVRYATRRFVPRRLRGVGGVVLGGVLLVGMLAPAVPFFEYGGAYLGDLEGIQRIRVETVDWIAENTSVDAVFACDPGEAYMTVAGLTGRKCAALPAGHTNPSVDAGQRLASVKALLLSGEETEFRRIAAELEVDYVFIKVDSATARRQVQNYRQWPALRQVFVSEKERAVVFAMTSIR